MSTMLHSLLAVILTLFLAVQVSHLARILRARRTALSSRPRGRLDLLWTSLPVLLVLLLAVRSWVAVLDVERPGAAAAVAVSGAADRAPGVPPGLPAR